jgi:hypothetical protein
MSKLIMSPVNIELTFKMLVGRDNDTLDGYIHADVFRHGDSEQLALLLQKTADVLTDRMVNTEFESWEYEAGQPKMRLGMAINNLRLIGQAIEIIKKQEPEDYHWNIIGMLITIIGSLFDHIDGRHICL